MSSVEERMNEAIRTSKASDGLGEVSIADLAKACAKVGTDDNAKLLDMLKAKNEQIASLTVSLADTHKYVDKLELEKLAVGAFNANAPATSETKRELIARCAMQALLSNASIGHYSDDKAEAYARSALACADALLRVLGVAP